MRQDPKRHEQTELTIRDQLAFMRIVDRETHRTGRRLIAAWVRPDALTDHLAERRLDQTLRLMWRNPPGSTGE